MKRATRIPTRRTTTTKRLAGAVAAALLAFAGSAAAGPTITFGKEGSLTFNYSFQGWAQDRGYTSSTDSGRQTDFFLRRNRLTFSGQYNDLVGFYANIDAPSDSRGGDDDKSIFFRDAYITVDHSDELRFIVGRFKTTQHYGTVPFTVTMQPIGRKLYDRPIDLHVVDLDHYELGYERGGEGVKKRFPFNEEVRDPDMIIRVDRAPYMTEKTVD